MMRASLFQASFAVGEVSPSFHPRSDLATYQMGARTIRNLIVRPEGGLARRPGTQFIAEVKDSTKKARLIPFQFSTEQSYVLEFGAGYIRFYADGARITNGGVPVEVATPYAESDLPNLRYAQSADMLFIACPNHMPRVLRRYSETSWAFDSIADLEDPFIPPLLDENTGTTQIKVIGQCQVFRPVADVSLGSWTNPSWPLLDEVTPNDADYSSCTGTSTLKVRLSAGIDPGSDKNHILRVRLWAAAECDGSVTLYSGAVPVGSWLIRAKTSPVTMVFYLTPVEAELIADYTDLQVQVTLTDGRVSWIELQAPYAAGSALNTEVSGYPLLKGTPVTLQASSPLFKATHHSFGLRHMSRTITTGFRTPARRAFKSSAIPVLGDWQISLKVVEQYYRDEADLYIEKSVDDGETWFKIKTWPASRSTADMMIAGTEEEFCFLRIGRDTDPTNIDMVDFTIEVYAFPEWSYASITGSPSGGDPGTSIDASLLTDFDQPGVAISSWAEAAWSNERGWPAAVCFFEDRLCFADTASQPQTVWMSVASDYTNFGVSIPVQDDDAVTATVVSRSVNAIQAMVPLKDLLLFTSGGEWVLGSDGQGPVTPSNVQARQYGYRGSAAISPIAVGNAALYIQRHSGALLEMVYDQNVQSYVSNDLSSLAKHLFGQYKAVETAYQQEPWSVIWVVRDDGKLIGLTYKKEQEILAWHLHELSGTDLFESICTIPGTGYDEIWVIAKRTVNGTTKRYVERFYGGLFRNEDTPYLDSSVVYSGPPTSVISGLSHLEGLPVLVMTSATTAPVTRTVTGGQVTLDAPTAWAAVGIGYQTVLETLGVEYQADGTAQDKKKRIVAVTLRVEKAKGGSCADKSSGTTRKIPYPVDVTSGFYTGDVRLNLESGYQTDGRVYFILQPEEPYPFTIYGLIPVVQHGG